MADSYEINLEIQGGEQPALVMETEGGATDGASARNAEAWANGTRNGVPVGENDPAYNKSSKYYRDSAAAIAAGDVIDDDAGHGDTMLAWSADKLVGEFSRKAPAIVVSDTTPEAVKTFSDGADGLPIGLTVGVEPVQDLNGYDNPWPVGSSKNILTVPDADFTLKGIRYFSKDGIITLNGTSTGEVSSTNVAFQNNFSFTLPAGTYYFDRKTFRTPTYLRKALDGSGSILATNSGTFTLEEETTVWLAFYISSRTYNNEVPPLQLEVGSTGTSFLPVSNICLISGFTGANVTRTGKNLCPIESLSARAYWGTGNADVRDFLNSLPIGTYTLYVTYKVETMPGNGKVTHGRPAITAMVGRTQVSVMGNTEIDDTSPSIGKTYRDGGTFTITESVKGKIDHCYFYCDQKDGHSGDDRGTYSIINIQIETGSIESDFEEYSGETYEIAFPQEAGTVYGATLTENADGTGTLVVDKAKCTYGSEVVSGEVVATATGCRADIPCVTTDINYSKWSVQSGAKPIFSHYGGNVSKGYSATQYTLFFDKVYTKQEINQMLGGMESVYKLATPQTYTLTAPQVESLKGMNNLWSDTGDIKAVEYPADTKLYVDGKISEGMKLMALLLTANHEDGMKASKAYASGDLLTVGNTLYKATTSIANGATLTAGTNVTETTIAQELAALA